MLHSRIRGSDPGGRPGESGFSLLETLTVLAVFAIIAGQVGLQIGAGTGAKDSAFSAAEISGFLKTAHRDARRDGRDRVAILAADNVTIRAMDQVDLTYRLPPGQSLAGPPRIVFSADGGATGGVVEVRGEQRAFQLRISRFDGGVTIERSKNALR